MTAFFFHRYLKDSVLSQIITLYTYLPHFIEVAMASILPTTNSNIYHQDGRGGYRSKKSTFFFHRLVRFPQMDFEVWVYCLINKTTYFNIRTIVCVMANGLFVNRPEKSVS